jgi:hypothetical protein
MVLPVKTRHIIFCSPGYKQKTECFYLVYKSRENVSSDPTLICTILAPAPHSGKSINQKQNYLHFVEWSKEYEKPNFRAISRLIKKLWQIYEVPETTHQVLL